MHGLLHLALDVINATGELLDLGESIFLQIRDLDDVTLHHLYSVELGLLEASPHLLVELLDLSLQLLGLDEKTLLALYGFLGVALAALC